MDIQALLNRFMQNRGQVDQQPPKKSDIFKYHPIVLPKNLSVFEQNIQSLLKNLFECKQCFNFTSNLADKLCDSCVKIMNKLQAVMFFGIFEKENHLTELSTFWKTGNNLKVYCGKILKATDVGYKCYDCEMDPTCIICKECFEKGDHRGHRTVIQKGCSGCCDCGDIEAWKKEGFCCDHKGFLTNEQLNIDQINKKYRDNCIQGFKFLFYYLFSQIEDLLQHTKDGQQIQILQQNLLIQKVFEYTILLIEKIVMKNPVLQNLFNHILCEQHFEEDRYKFKHCCPDLITRVTIGSDKTHPLQKCQCTILEMMLRYIVAFNSEVQEKIKNFYISMFNLYHFKQNLIKAYTKMFNFFYFYKEGVQEKDSHPFITNFVDLNVQLFTSDILAGYALDIKTENYVIEYVMAKNSSQSSRKGSVNLRKKSLEQESKRKQSDGNVNTKAGRKLSDKAFEKVYKSCLFIICLLFNFIVTTFGKLGRLILSAKSKFLLFLYLLHKPQLNGKQEINAIARETVQQNGNQDQSMGEEEDLQEESKSQEDQILIEENVIPPQQAEEREEDFETEEEEGEGEGEGEEEYEEEEEDDDDDGEFSDSEDMHVDYFEQDIDDKVPLFDNKEQQSDISQINNYVNEYYFGNIFDKLLLFATYSFKQKSVIEQFFKTFYHLKYISQKEFSLSKLIEKDFFRIKFIELLSKMHSKIENKLKRSFETIYENDQYCFNGTDCEKLILSILRKIVCFLHTDKSVDEAKFNKIHIDYMKLLMQKMIQTHEKYEKQTLNDTSSIHIPLHRALTILIFSYFKFDFENITSQSLNQLSRSLNLENDELKRFFLEQLKYPLQVISFMKEIDSGVWNNHGEEFKYLTVAYISQDLGFQFYDTLFFQFVIRIVSTDFKQLSSMFSSKKEFSHIVTMNLSKIKKENKDFLEKNEKVLAEFFSFISYSLLDTVSLYNLTQSIFHNTPEQLNPFIKHSNNFIASYMHQFKSASIQEVSESLIKAFGKYVDITTLLVQVANFDKSTKKFAVMEKYSKICEPNLFFWSPVIKSVYHDKTFQKYQNSKEIQTYLLGNLELNHVQKQSLKNIINQKSFSFIQDLIRQPFISNQLEQKKSIAQQHLLTPILKLILLFVQNRSSFQHVETIELHANNIMTFLVQFKDNYGKELLDTIQYLQEKLSKATQQLIFTKQQSIEDEESAKKKKEEILKKQQEILKLFQQRSQTYSEKNKDDLVLERSTSGGDNCVICKKTLDEEAEYGYGVYCQKTNIYEFSELKGFIQQNHKEEDQQRLLHIEATKNDQCWNLKEGNWQINSCFHHIHKSCYQQYLFTKNKQKQQSQFMRNQYFYEFEYKCPLCNKLLNSFLTHVHNQTAKTLTETLSVQESSKKGEIGTQVEWIALKVDSSSTPEQQQNQPQQDLKTHDISKQISEYEIMNKKRICEMSTASQKEGEFMYKKFVESKTGDTLDNEKEPDYLSNQIEFINIMQYENEKQTNKNEMETEKTSSDDQAITRIENIILNQLRMTDFDCSPIALISQHKKLSLLRQILKNLNNTLGSKNLTSFYTWRYNYCQDVLHLFNDIVTKPQTTLSQNLLENDLKEMYLKFLFYSFNYFNEEGQALQLIQKTITSVLLAKFVQIHLIQLKKKQQSELSVDHHKIVLDEINTFNDNESCQYNVDILQRTWNVLSLFLEFDTEINLNLQTIFDDSKSEVQNLLNYMNVSIPTQEEQKKFLQKCIEHKFDQNQTNILKITPNNTSFSFTSIEYKFSDLFKKYQSAKCSLCDDISKYYGANLCLCLICGDVLCSIGCKQYENNELKGHLGNLNKHAKQMHCNQSLYLDLTTSVVIYVSFPHNCSTTELYVNSFGIPFKKTAKDWSLFQLDNAQLSKLHQSATNISIIDDIKLNEIKTNMQYKYHFY